MLVLTRLQGEQVIIGTGEQAITVTVVEFRGDKIRLGFDAPKDVPVNRKEVAVVRDKIDRERAASGTLVPQGNKGPVVVRPAA